MCVQSLKSGIRERGDAQISGCFQQAILEEPQGLGLYGTRTTNTKYILVPCGDMNRPCAIGTAIHTSACEIRNKFNERNQCNSVEIPVMLAICAELRAPLTRERGAIPGCQDGRSSGILLRAVSSVRHSGRGGCWESWSSNRSIVACRDVGRDMNATPKQGDNGRLKAGLTH